MSEKNHDYYTQSYYKLQRSGFVGWGNSIIDRLVEKRASDKKKLDVIEIGGSSGEHLTFVNNFGEWNTYTIVDLIPGATNPKLYDTLKSKQIKFIKADARELPLQSSSFDLCILTCVLAHTAEPQAVVKEIKRVIKDGGKIVIGMPTDPGIVNRIIKKIITFPKMRKQGIVSPQYCYALEHINPIHNLLAILKEEFKNSNIKFSYFPFKIKSWNLNLVIVFECIFTNK